MLKSTILSAIAAAKIACQDVLIKAQLVVQSELIYEPGTEPYYEEEVYGISIYYDKFESKEIDGDRVLNSDLKGIIFPEDDVPVPQPNNVIRDGNTDYRIIFNDKVVVGASIALSQVQLRILNVT